MNTKKLLVKSNLALTVIIVVGILIVLNFFSYNIFHRFDLTQNKDYSLSSASKKTVANLKDIVNIKVYFSSNLPTQYLNLKQEVADILEEYSNYSGNKVKVEFIDPKNDEATVQELYLEGIPQLQFNALEKDKYQVVNGYLGMAIKYGDKAQAIPVIQDTRDFEYQVTSAIKKLTDSQVARIGFWQGSGAADTQTEIAAAFKSLSRNYDVFNVNFSTDKKIANDITTLILAGPKEKFKDEELKVLDDFLMKGGSLIILVNGVNVEQGLKSATNDAGLNKLFESYGVKLNNDLVADVNNGLASFSQGFMTFTVDYPFWPKVINAGFDKNNLAVAKLESLVLPWASSISVTPDKIKDLKVSYLAQTTDRAMAIADKFDLSPQAQISNGAKGKFNLALFLSGNFKSAYGAPSLKPGRLVLVGDCDFVYDGFLRNYPDNLLFFENITDSLSLGDDLIAIRSKGVTERPLKETSDSTKAAIRYANIFGLTAVVVLFGLARYFLRRRRKAVGEI